MKIFMFVFLFLAGNITVADPDIKKVRLLSERASEDEDASEELLELLEPYDVSNPLLYGYKGIATMIKAKHVFNPFKRLSYFKKGKAILAEAIEADPSNIELHYLRFSAQTKAPKFLGYNEFLDEDRKFLIKVLPGIDHKEMKNKVKNFLLEAESTTVQEKEQIKKVRD